MNNIPYRGQKIPDIFEKELAESKDGELDEYPDLECSHCDKGPCHYAYKSRCISSCIYVGPNQRCANVSAHIDGYRR